MTPDEKLARLEQEIDSLDTAIGSMAVEQTNAEAQTKGLQIAVRFESCEGVLKSLWKDIADKGKDDALRIKVYSLRDKLSSLLDKYDSLLGRG